MADEELNQLVEEALWFALDKSQSPPSQADTIAAALVANPDVVLRQFTVVQAMEAHGWNSRMIGAAMDARYQGMD